MSKREAFPWFKFYPIDYLRATRHMTLEQRGAYMDAICLQMERGAPLPDDCSWLAHQMHISTRKARAIVDELIDLQKIKRTPQGLSNDRCEAEIEAREKQRQANTATAERREKERAQKAAVVDDKSNVSRLVHEDFTAEPQFNEPWFNSENLEKPCEINDGVKNSCSEKSHTRARRESEEERKKEDIRAAGAAPVAVEVSFEEFWQAFPTERRRGKGKCREVFTRIVTGKDRKRCATAEQIIAAVKAGHGIDPNFAPMPETWLNQGRWEDAPTSAAEPAPVNGQAWGWWSGREETLKRLSIERWRKGILDAKPNGTWPWWILGPPPGHQDCLVPPALLDEFGYVEIYKGQITHA